MRTREKGYEYYGITRERLQEIKEICRGESQELRRNIILSAYEANPVFGAAIAYSILNGFASFIRVAKIMQIEIDPNDFYAYRRKAVALLNEKLN